VSRELPGQAYVNSTVNVTLSLTIPPFGEGDIPDFITVEEILPSNWSILSANPSGTAVQNTIQWDLQLEAGYFPGVTINLTYTAGIPASVEGNFAFAGQFSCNYSNGTQTAEDIGGDLMLPVSIACELLGDVAPCNEIELAEVIDFITLWSTEQADLADVVDLITAWQAGF